MRCTIPLALLGVALLAGCASPGTPTDSSAPGSPSTASSAAPSIDASESASPSGDASPSPSRTGDDDDGRATRITDDSVLAQADLTELGADPLVMWGEEFSTVLVFGAGSGTESCQPVGEEIEIDDDGTTLEIEFESPDTDGVCTADLRVFGWEFTLPAEGSDRITTAQINDWAEDRDDIEVEILPAR